MQSKISPEQALYDMEQFLQNSKPEQQENAFANAAAVLVFFDPETLHAYQTNETGWSDFFHFCDPVKNRAQGNFWQLRPLVRRKALQRLGSRNEMQRALAANPGRTKEPVQKIYEALISGEPIDILHLQRDELVALSLMTEWLDNIPSLDLTELKREVQLAIPMADLLAPFNRLAGVQFVGRRKELATMDEYVGISSASSGLFSSAERFIRQFFTDLHKNPPLLIYGPGGIGKSTLIGKFILNNASQRNGALPFAYLDTDRSVIEPGQPLTYLIEAARQLALQCPEQRMQLMALKDDITAILSSYDGFESSKSFYEGGSIAVRFGQIISQVNTPVLLVIDTFEEAQFLGGEIVHGVWSLLVRLQEAAPNLRTIVGGRAMVQQFPVKPLELPELSREEVQELIAAVLKNSFNESELRKVVDDIINVAGMNPMSLRMALIIVQEQGVDKLRKVETRNWFMRRLRTEVIQARLYGRILTHIHNEKVKQLAYPGLIVRRITADVIREVLAGPCQLKLKNAGEADELTDLLANEASLVTRDPVDGALCHRQDVRRVMLQDLQNEISAAVIKAIHDNAVNYYSKQNDPIARAEEIYHRLSRGDSIQDVEKRWMPGIENRLRNALEELPSKSLLWLSGKLGVTPDKDMLKMASLGEWESITATAAERYLNTGEAQIALDTIRERDDRTTNSPLYRLELEALRNLGLYDEAAFVAEEMLATIPLSADPAILFEINMQAAFIKEAQGRIEEAIVYLRQASSLQSPEPTKEGLRILITHIRLLRKLGDEKNAERAVFVKQVRDWLADRQLLMSLSSSPALLREVVAELGKIMPELLENAIDWVGIEIRNDLQANVLSQALTNWNAELQKDSNSLLGELLERTGIKDNTLQSWNTFVKENNGRRLSNNIQHWRKELSSDLPGQSNGVSINFDNTLVDIYRINVDLSINRSSMEGGGMTVF